jgi:hypothetical protein
MVDDVFRHFFAVRDSKISARAPENNVIVQCSGTHEDCPRATAFSDLTEEFIQRR